MQNSSQNDLLVHALAAAKANLAKAQDEVVKAQKELDASQQLYRLEMSRVVETTPDLQSALTNLVYVNEKDEIARYAFIEAGGYVFSVGIHPLIFSGGLGLGNLQRKIVRVAVGDKLNVKPYSPKSIPDLEMLYLDISNFADSNLRECEIDADELITQLIRVFGGQIFTMTQIVAFEYYGSNYRFTVSNMTAGNQACSEPISRGLLREKTTIIFTNSSQNLIKIGRWPNRFPPLV